jgi:hypothetical protein
MLSATSTRLAPWYIVPADSKWFMRACVADVIASRMQDLELEYPRVTRDQQSRLDEILANLRAENTRG